MTKIPDYKKLSASECAEIILKTENPAVLIHTRPDGDAVGSAAALCEIFRQLGKECTILSADKIPSRLDFILRYTGAKIGTDGEKYTAIAIDVASPSQLGSLYEKYPSPALMIDHHAIGEQFADGYILPEASSAAEPLLHVAYELIERGKIKMTKKLAYALYSAISSDTGCFAYSNTTPKTLRYAAELVETGINSADINQKLFYSKTLSQIKAEGIVSKKLKAAFSGRVSYAVITLRDLNEENLSLDDFETAIDIVRSVCGAEISFIIKETEAGIYKASLRSTGANVAEIASEFGGGGHIRAAGCSLKGLSEEDTVKLLLSKIENIL